MAEPKQPALAQLVPFAAPLYLVAGMLILFPPLEMLFSLPNIAPSSVHWRFGTVGVLTGGIAVPLLGLTLFVLTALVFRQRWMYRIGAALVAFVLAALAIGLPVFILDALQVRTTVTEDGLRRFDIAVAKSLATQLVQIFILAVLLWKTMALRQLVRRDVATERASASMLVASHSRTTAP